jgi:hypothetical protein
MTEAEWRDCCEPEKMLTFLHESGRASDRKLRLFACACLRRVWPSHGAAEREVVRVAEHYADREAKVGSLLNAARRAGWPLALSGVTFLPRGLPRESHAEHAVKTAAFCAAQAAELAGAGAYDRERAHDRERAAQAGLLRCVFGSPCRKRSSDPAWRTPDVVALARSAYKERATPEGTLDPQRLAVLADALEEAGCANPDILGHLRGPGPHVRGCFVTDLLLGRE